MVRVPTLRRTPNVVVIIDRSGSMTQPFSGGGTRWTALRMALSSMPDGITYILRNAVRFGVVFYSDDPEFGGCPDVSNVRAALDNFTAIDMAYGRNTPGGNTPTGDAVGGALSRIAMLAPERMDPTFFLLATDGEPGSCADSSDIVAGRALVIDQVTAAFEMGIPTYVLSVGPDVAMSHLQDVANAGTGVAPGGADAPFWVANDYAGLTDALATIVGGVISCEIELEGEINPAFACSGLVTLGGDELECETDWRATDGTHIELLGEACERLQSGADEELVATFPCDVLI
jgi:hypothetical protein